MIAVAKFGSDCGDEIALPIASTPNRQDWPNAGEIVVGFPTCWSAGMKERTMLHRVGTLLAVCMCLGLASPSTASAEPGSIAIELNKVEAVPTGCRLHFDVHNSTAMKFNVLSADLVFFDSDGVMSSRSLVSFGRLHPHKHHFNSWEFPAVDCLKVSRILVNGLQQCQHDGDESFDCLSALSTSHKGAIELVK